MSKLVIKSTSGNNTMKIGGVSTHNIIVYSDAPQYSVTPESFPGLYVWFRAEDLSFLGEGGLVSTGSNSWVNFANTSISASRYGVGYEPKYTTQKIAGGKSAVHFDNSATIDYLVMNATYDLSGSTVMVLFKGNGIDSMILGASGVNRQVRRFRSNNNDISSYNDSVDTTSGTFNSSISQSAVLVYVFGGIPGGSIYYEGKYNRNTGGFGPDGINLIGQVSYSQPATGSIAEICIWSGSLSTASITSLYDNYWKVKYSAEGLLD